MRVLLRFIILLLVAVLLWPQDPVRETVQAEESLEAIDGIESTTSSTLPIDERDLPQGLLKKWPGATDDFRAKNPNAVENRARRGKGVMHFDVEEDAGGAPGGPPLPPGLGKAKKGVAVFADDSTYKDPATGEWQVVEPTFWTTQRGWVQTGTPVDVVVYHRTGNQSYVIQHQMDADTGERYWMGLAFPRLTYVTDSRFSYQHNKHPWKLWATLYGFSFASEPVTGRRGALTFNFPFEASHPMRVDAAGHVVSDHSPLRLAPAAMMGADGVSYPCAAWAISGGTLSFICNDTELPNAALPYIIDPVATYHATIFANNVNVEDPSYSPYMLNPRANNSVFHGNDAPYTPGVRWTPLFGQNFAVS